MNFKIKQLLTMATLITVMTPVLAGTKNIDARALTCQIEALNARVTMLESVVSFSSFGPDYVEHLKKMQKAANNDECEETLDMLLEMKRLSEKSRSVNIFDDFSGLPLVP